MNFDVFDRKEMEKYKEEVAAKWGNTKAYREFQQKEAAREEGSSGRIAEELMAMFSELGGLKQLPPDADEVQKKIAALQEFITGNYYECTDEILSGLGQMYAEDERFRKNIDRAGGEGTAAFAGKAIAVYCAH